VLIKTNKTNMKSKEEIEQLAFKSYGDGFLKGSFIHGYTQCQEDMATTKEFMSKETLDELFNLHDDDDFIDGVMADKKYTEEDIRKAITFGQGNGIIADVTGSKINNYYPILLRSHAYEKLLAIQTIPETKYWFKDEEITIEKLIHILETA